ncbi:FAD-linked oxidase C-terminal domain-containing protein [Acidiplasma cupricumulans]|nr:FAD-linked oxidase C-terminal domain-containing protein [Acidiplasma cupricumulans]
MDAILAIRKLNPLILEFSDYYGIVAANKIRGFSYPETRGGMVLADTDFDESYLEDIKKIMEKNASKIIIPENKDEFNNIFEVRRIAFTAPGILFPGFIDGDVVVPLSKLKDMINFVYKTREKYGVYIATCGHAGDGNLHPQIGGNPDDHENWRNVLLAMDDINIEAVRLGGSISGEHGIGRIKKDLLLKQLKYKKQDETIIIMKNLKKMFDPKNILNRGNFFD